MPRAFFITTGIIFICMAAIVIAGCMIPDDAQPPRPPGQPPTAEYSFDLTNNGETHAVGLDAPIQLKLPENPTTGYTWQLHTSPGIVITNVSYIPDDSTGRLVGSGGTRIWEMRAVQPGIQEISGIHARPWESSAENMTSYSLILDVGSSPESRPGLTVYTELDSGREVPETLGREFEIRITENPTTGYSWNLTLSPGLLLLHDEYIPSRMDENMVGIGGIRVFRIDTMETGQQHVHAEYRRPWIASGTVIFLDLEGGFYGIRGDDGEDYYPVRLDEEFQVHGLRVSFESEPAKDVVTIHMWGIPVNLIFIEEIPLFDLSPVVT